MTASLSPGNFAPLGATLAANYTFPTSASGAASITPVTLTASIVGNPTKPTKPYDGTTASTLTSTNFSLTPLVGSESFTVTQTAGTYNSKNVTSATTVTASLAAGNFTPVGGTLASNYMLPTTASGPACITAVTLTASIVGNPNAPTKPYNGTLTSVLTSTNFSIAHLVGSESFTVTQTAGTYNSANVAGATVTASLSPGNFTPLGSTLASNYMLPTTASGAASITAVTLTASIIGNPTKPTKPYDGTTASKLTSTNFALTPLVGAESFTVTQTVGTYNSQNVTMATTVTASLAAGNFTPVGSTLASNYVLPTTASGPACITAVTLTASIVGNPTKPTKPYDGTTASTLTSTNFSLAPLVGSESFTVTQTAGTYNSPNVATATTVTASLAAGNFTPLGTTLASNYVLPTTASGPACITPVTLTASIIGNPTKPYDGGTTATLIPANFSIAHLVGTESFTVTQTAGTYNSQNVGIATTVIASLAPSNFTPVGATLATNYVLPTTASGPGSITAVTLTASIVGNPTKPIKPYDGTLTSALTSTNFSIAHLVGSESFTVTQTAGTYNSPNVMTATTVTASLAAGNFTAGAGTVATNYVLPTTASGPACITPVTLTASIIGTPTKPYDGGTVATLIPANFSITHLIGTESFTVTQTVGTYNSPNVATATTVTASLVSGNFTPVGATLASNYVLPTTASGSGSITKVASVTIVTCPAGPYTYTGLAQTPCSATVTGAGSLSLAPTPSYSNNINAGTATASYAYADDGNHTGSSSMANFTIGPAPSVTTVNCPSSTVYTGSAQTPCSATVTGAGGLSLTPTPSYSNNISAGTATANYTYAGDTNHTGSMGSANFTILQATPTVTDGGPTPSSPDYGQPVTLTVTVAPPASGEVPTGTVTFSFILNSITNYICSDGTISTSLPACTVQLTYNGTNYIASVSPGKLPTGAENVMAAYSGDTNFQPETATPLSVTVTQASSGVTLTSSTNSSTYGSAVNLTVAVTDATGGSIGVPTGTVTLAFMLDPTVPGGQMYYICADGSVVTTACMDPVTLAPDPMNPIGATVTVQNIALPAGLATFAGANPPTPYSYPINATYSGDTNFAASAIGLSQTVNQATPTVTVNGNTCSYNGTACAGSGTATGVLTPADNLTPVVLTYTGTGSTTYGPSTTAPTNAGTYSATANFAGNANYASASSPNPPATITINPAPVTATAGSYSGTYDGGMHSPSGCVVTPIAPNTFTGSVSCTNNPSSVGNAGSGQVAPVPAVGGDSVNNYAITLASGAWSIGQATANITVTPYTVTYDGNPHTATGTATGLGAPPVNLSADLTLSTTHTSPGTYSIDSWSFTDPAGNYAPVGPTTITDTIIGFTPTTGGLNTARENATATLLSDGTVLIAGGQDSNGNSLGSAELYNPNTGLFSLTRPNDGRALRSHSTLLPNGQVLITGGQGSSGPALQSAELYDPTIGDLQLHHRLNDRRAGESDSNSATKRPVLIAGGNDGNVLLASAELYDPSTGSFTVTGPMGTARYVPTAALLPNGQVLVAGGITTPNPTYVASAEVYDPTLGTFSYTTGSMSSKRGYFTATALQNGQVLVAGGYNGSAQVTTAELYDPTAKTFSLTTGSMTNVQGGPATLLGDGQVLIAGGYNGSSYLTTSELYNPTTKMFSVTGPMITARNGPAATLLANGQVLVVGGANSSGVLASAELYAPPN